MPLTTKRFLISLKKELNVAGWIILHAVVPFLKHFFKCHHLNTKPILYASQLDASSLHRTLEKMARKWPEAKQIIISVIEANPTATISLLEQQTGKGHTTVKKYIKQLQEEGLLTRIGPDKGGYWKVNDRLTNARFWAGNKIMPLFSFLIFYI